MASSAGILTTTGGLASHAAVVARGWGIPAVVGAAAVRVGNGEVAIGDETFRPGDTITIDGGTGEVFRGAAAGVSFVVPEAAILLGWAREAGIEIGAPPADATAATGPAAAGAEGATGAEGAAGAAPSTSGLVADDVLRVLAIKGYATPDAVAVATGGSPDDATTVLDRLVADGLAEIAAGAFRLTADGKAIARERIADDTAAWGIERANAALDGFLDLDRRMKATVTAWQMREVDGEQVFNDHADAAYDAGVLADLAALHADAEAWLQPLTDELPRLGSYLGRLERANAAAQAGDPKYVASPRVDSYHGVWFELHEDLIGLAGRNRADEVAAGRA
jgi:pyruvate,orthophosphate dikinase